MWEYDEYPEVERSEIDLLLAEYKEKCMDLIRESINLEIRTITNDNKRLIKENEELRKENRELKNIAASNEKLLSESKIMMMLVDNIKQFKDDKDKIYKFLSCIFEKDYEENTYDTPLWIGALTQYYSHKDEVLQLLKIIDVKLPNGVENFRLPIDWTEEEMDIFFSTMSNHVNCNNCVYKDNLRFWSINALDTVECQCKKTLYDEIPWQYVLRNPVLKKEKYLKQIGEHFTDKYFNNWYKFEEITEYLKLSDEEIKVIIDNIDKVLLTPEMAALDFIFKNLNLVTDKVMLKKIYDYYKDSYDFKYGNKLFDMPYEYTKKWVSEHTKECMLWVERHRDKLTEEQRKELLMIALG